MFSKKNYLAADCGDLGPLRRQLLLDWQGLLLVDKISGALYVDLNQNRTSISSICCEWSNTEMIIRNS